MSPERNQASPAGDPPCIMEFMTVREVRAALRRTRTVLLPMGIVEQHGYHLPLWTDTYTAYEVSKRVAAATGCLVAPPLGYAFSGGTLPGTINISPQVVSMMVMEILESLANQGFKSLVLVLGHGGTENTHAMKEAADMFQRRNPHLKDVAVAVAPFWEVAPTVMKGFRQKDFHSGYVETSMMLYWKPELVRDDRPTDSEDIMEMFRRDQDSYQVLEKPVDHAYVEPKVKQHPGIRVGVMGDPSRADPAIGERICREAVQGIADLVRKLEGRRRHKQ